MNDMKLVDKDEQLAHEIVKTPEAAERSVTNAELDRIRCHSIYTIFSANCVGFEAEFRTLQSVFEASEPGTETDATLEAEDAVDTRKSFLGRMFS